MASTQKKISRVRKPRVHITYDVETGDAVENKELPFVVGVMGDFSGDPTSPLKKLKERSFVNIDRDNLDSVMSKMTPGLNLKVDNTLANDGSEMGVNLKFSSMDDFSPANVVAQVEPLQKLRETRDRLRDLLAKMDSSEDLEEILEKVMKDSSALQKLAGELGIDASAAEPEASGDSGEGGGE
jgi:type VI secretion system protein ImpB